MVKIDCPRTFVGLFGGIGGFDLALVRLGWNCLGYYEIDKYAVQTYNKNFKTDYKPTDITKLDAGSVPDHTLLCGGFPCQAFSIAGKRRGFEDTRGTLFFEIMRIARAKRTPYLLLENVKGLLNHDSGKTFEVILRTLDECGYDAEWQVLNSKDFGVPQNRERVFIFASRRECLSIRWGERPSASSQRNIENSQIRSDRQPREWRDRIKQQSKDHVFPISREEFVHCSCEACRHSGGESGSEVFSVGEPSKEPSQRLSEAEVASALQSPGHSCGNYRGMNMIEITRNVSDAQRIYDSQGIAKTLKGLGGGQGAKTGLYLMNTLTQATGNRAGSSSEFLRSVKNVYGSIGQIRRLTPIECERLQGFPDRWTAGVSDTQRYKQLGNAVTVNVVEAIAKRINQSLFEEGKLGELAA